MVAVNKPDFWRETGYEKRFWEDKHDPKYNDYRAMEASWHDDAENIDFDPENNCPGVIYVLYNAKTGNLFYIGISLSKARREQHIKTAFDAGTKNYSQEVCKWIRDSCDGSVEVAKVLIQWKPVKKVWLPRLKGNDGSEEFKKKEQKWMIGILTKFETEYINNVKAKHRLVNQRQVYHKSPVKPSLDLDKTDKVACLLQEAIDFPSRRNEIINALYYMIK